MIIVRAEDDAGNVEIAIGIDMSTVLALVAGKSTSMRVTVGDAQVTVILFVGETDQALDASVRQMARRLDRRVVDISAPPSTAIN